MDKIFIIEDDVNLQEYIGEYLSAYDYEVKVINDFNNLLGEVKEFEPDLILLDINLPVYDGFYFLRLIRKQYKTPVIILSARSEEGEQIRGMELGADDYVTKPFSVGVLLAKVNALLRRVSEYTDVEKLSVGNFTLIDESMKLKCGESIVELSKNEYKIMKILIKNYESLVSREELLESLWDDEAFVDNNTLTVNITRVKKKLLELGGEYVITTKRGVGYGLNKNN